MNAILLMVIPFVGFIAAYHLYGRFLARKIFRLDPQAKVPSIEYNDGKDYVPTRKEIIFGHHFTSIAGTGPIVGPAIGIIWGWVPAILWVVLGSIFMGAVHDFGSLVVSLRNRGVSLSEIAGKYIHRRVRFIFFLIVFFELWIVIAIFAMIMGLLFVKYPHSVFPVWLEIPIAVALGHIIYKRGGNVKLFTTIAVVLMYATVVFGTYTKFEILPIAGVSPAGIWTIILFIYAYIASTLPVPTLLQPRDYINSWQLMVAMGLLIIGAFLSGIRDNMTIVAPAFANPPDAPSMFPFLFVVIACGAISGFHSLVASGTTPKELRRETDAKYVGYGSMLLEGALATLVIVAVAAGIGIGYEVVSDGQSQILTGSAAWRHHYASFSAAQGLNSKIGAFVTGAANMIDNLGISNGLAVTIMAVFIVSFAGTTLDTATRVQRYVVAELARDIKVKPLANAWVATGIAVVTAAVLAFATGTTGTGALRLWPMFGAVNQLLAALALLVVTMYLKTKGGRKFLVAAIPCVFMLVITFCAVVLNEINFITNKKTVSVEAVGMYENMAAWPLPDGVRRIHTARIVLPVRQAEQEIRYNVYSLHGDFERVRSRWETRHYAHPWERTDTAPITSVTVGARPDESAETPAATGTVTLDITELAQGWLSMARPNHPVEIVADPATPDTYFAAWDDPAEAVGMRPKLELVVPDPRVLLAVINGAVALLAAWMTVETVVAFLKPSGAPTSATA